MHCIVIFVIIQVNNRIEKYRIFRDYPIFLHKNMTQKKLTSKEAAHYLGVEETTLRSWRWKKKPPIPYYQYLKFGKVMYKIEDLDEFLTKSKK